MRVVFSFFTVDPFHLHNHVFYWLQMDDYYSTMRNDDIKIHIDLSGIVVLTVCIYIILYPLFVMIRFFEKVYPTFRNAVTAQKFFLKNEIFLVSND